MGKYTESFMRGVKGSARAYIAPLVVLWMGVKWIFKFTDNYADYGKSHTHHH